MQRKDLALRVLSTAAIMSIVTSIAAPAFADIYYIGNGSIDVVTKEDADGKKYVEVKQGDKTYTDTSDEIVIKDGNNEGNAAQKEESRIEGKKAKVAIPDGERTDTQELEAAGSADAAGESQPDPDDAFTLNETEEDSAQTQEGEDTTKEEEDSPKDPSTDNPTANPKKDVVYEYAPADPEPEQQATKLAPTTSANPAAETREAAQANAPAAAPTTPTAPAADPPAEGSAGNPTQNVIRVINNWAEKVLNIRLSNVNIKPDSTSSYADGTKGVVYNQYHNGHYGVSSAEVQGTGNTKIELDGQNVLDNSVVNNWAGLRKMDSGNLTITDETSDKGETITAKEETDTSGSLRAEGGIYGGAAIGGSLRQATENITIEGYATVKANTLGHDGAGIGGGNGAKGSNITIQGHANVMADGGKSAAGIGGGGRCDDGGGDAENITIQDYAKVTATAYYGAAIGSGSAYDRIKKSGDAKNIVIRGHATVVAKNDSDGAAIGAAGYKAGASAEVIIGTADATAEQEDVHVTATGVYGSAIGNGAIDTKVTIQGRVTIQTASSRNYTAIGSGVGDVTVNITDNVAIDNEDTVTNTTPYYVSSGIGGGYINSSLGRTVVVNIDGEKGGKVKLGEKSALTGYYGAISGTEVNIGDNVLLKMKQRYKGSAYIAPYIAVNNAEAAVGTRSNPTAGGLVNTIGDNTELWYTNYYNKLQKIVHGKNLCTKHETNHKDATCTTPGSKTYQCTYEKDNGAVNPEHNDQWTENTDIDPNAHNYVKTTVPPTCGAQGYDVYTCTHDSSHTYKDNYTPATGLHTYGEWTVKTPATCEGEGVEHRTCSVCNKEETRSIPVTGHLWKEDHRTGNCGVAGDIYYVCEHDSSHTKTEHVDATGNHQFNAWHQTKAPTCMEEGEEQHECEVCGKPETRKVDKLDHVEELRGAKEPTCTEPGYTGDKWCTRGDHLLEKGSVIPATGHHWKDNGDGTHTCPDCGATETLPVNTNSALELRVVDAEGMNQPFTVSQNGTLRTYTGAYDIATLTGDLDTLRYLQEHGAQTIQFVTNGQTSSFAINDLLAQGSGSEVFYLTHRGAEEPTLLLVEADHSELVKD